MAEKKKRVTSAVMVVEYKVIKNRRGSIELSNGMNCIPDNGSSVGLPTIKRSSTPRSDVVSVRPSSSRRGSRQEEILKSMIDQLSSTGGSSIKAPSSIPAQLQGALLKNGPVSQRGRRMSVQERIVIMKDSPSRVGSAQSSAILSRRNTEPMLAFVQNTQPQIHHGTATNGGGSGLRSDGNTTNTTSSSLLNGGQENIVHTNKVDKDTAEYLPPKEEDILEEAENDPNSPGVKLAIAKCKSWIQDLPEKFSGLNVLTFPDIQSNK